MGDQIAPLPAVLLDWTVANSEGQFVFTWIALTITAFLYGMLTVFGLRNFFKYIVKQQNQLKLLYVFAIFATGARTGKYLAMIYNLIRGDPIYTQLSLIVDLVISSLLVAVGLCLTLIMFKLFSLLQCWSIQLHQQREHFNNQDRMAETREMQKQQAIKFTVLQYSLHILMVLAAILTTLQISLIYGESEFSGTSPTQVTAKEFVTSQKDLVWYSPLNMRMVFVEQGFLFALDAVLLYTSIFFLVSVMNDLSSQNNLMYVEGSGSMENEKKRLKIIMTVFGTSYILRAAFDLIIGLYLLEVQTFASDYPGFFELAQTVYFIVTDIVPILAFLRMHHQVYREEDAAQVQMVVDPDAARAYQLQGGNQQYLQTVLLNIIEGTESSESRTESRDSFNIHDAYSDRNNQLYQEGFGSRQGPPTGSQGSDVNFSDLNNSKPKVVSHGGSFKSMNRCGLLSRVAIRQIQSDIVTIEALSRLQASEIQSQHLNQSVHQEEEKGDELYQEVLLEEKPGRLSEDIANYNKAKNHFSKSTADESEVGVKDLENLLGVDGGPLSNPNRHSGAVASLDF